MLLFLVSCVALMGLICGDVAHAGDRRPVLVTSRQFVVATVRCVTIQGVDYDLQPILLEYRREWTWPGDTEATLRAHLRDEHKVTGIESLSDREIRKLHAVLHERAKAAQVRATIRADPVVRSGGCPGGVCPAPQRVFSPRRRLLFHW